MTKEEQIEKYGLDEYLRRCKKSRDYYYNHKQQCQEKNKEWKENNKDKIKEYNNSHKEGNKNRTNKYRNIHPDRARATLLAQNYKNKDRKLNRGESTITQSYILEHIFTSKCFYCGCDDWKQLGCDRIDNDKPHTPDNVVCSCWNCNNERGKMSFEEFVNKKKSLL